MFEGFKIVSEIDRPETCRYCDAPAARVVEVHGVAIPVCGKHIHRAYQNLESGGEKSDELYSIPKDEERERERKRKRDKARRERKKMEKGGQVWTQEEQSDHLHEADHREIMEWFGGPITGSNRIFNHLSVFHGLTRGDPRIPSMRFPMDFAKASDLLRDLFDREHDVDPENFVIKHKTASLTGQNIPGTVYLIHFDEPICPVPRTVDPQTGKITGHTTQHYIGWAEPGRLMDRIDQHRKGQGARLTQVAKERDIGFQLVRVWDDQDRYFERELKNRKSGPKLCPVCNPPKTAHNPKSLLREEDDPRGIYREDQYGRSRKIPRLPGMWIGLGPHDYFNDRQNVRVEGTEGPHLEQFDGAGQCSVCRANMGHGVMLRHPDKEYSPLVCNKCIAGLVDAAEMGEPQPRLSQVQRYCLGCHREFDETEHGHPTGLCGNCREKEGLVTHHWWSEKAQEGHLGAKKQEPAVSINPGCNAPLPRTKRKPCPDCGSKAIQHWIPCPDHKLTLYIYQKCSKCENGTIECPKQTTDPLAHFRGRDDPRGPVTIRQKDRCTSCRGGGRVLCPQCGGGSRILEGKSRYPSRVKNLQERVDNSDYAEMRCERCRALQLVGDRIWGRTWDNQFKLDKLPPLPPRETTCNNPIHDAMCDESPAHWSLNAIEGGRLRWNGYCADHWNTRNAQGSIMQTDNDPSKSCFACGREHPPGTTDG
jgi:hypothetical protein